MTQTIVLIDYENVGTPGLDGLPAQCRVILFVGRTQVLPKNSDIEKLLNDGKRVEFIKMAGLGKDNLDHHLALYLGKTIALEPHADYIIISNDKSGFDPLAKHVNDVLGISCKRITPVRKPATKPVAAPAPVKAAAPPAKPAGKPAAKPAAAKPAAKEKKVKPAALVKDALKKLNEAATLPDTWNKLRGFLEKALKLPPDLAGQVLHQMELKKIFEVKDKGRLAYGKDVPRPGTPPPPAT